MTTLFLSFLIGLFSGLRSLSAPAVVAWATYLGRLRLARPLSLIGTLPAVAILTVLAIVELVADKLPNTPSRTAPAGLIARILMGGLAGACMAAGNAQGAVPGAIAGALGGITGCFAGYKARTGLVSALKTRDVYIALLEDLVTIAGCIWVVTRL